jgi:hypothetical protein
MMRAGLNHRELPPSKELHQSKPTLRKNNSTSKKAGGSSFSLFTVVSGCLLLFFAIYLVVLISYGRQSILVSNLENTNTNANANANANAKEATTGNKSASYMRPKSSTTLKPSVNLNNPACVFRKYPPRRYYGLNDSKWPDFLETADYIFGERPQLLTQPEGGTAVKLCVDQSEWDHPNQQNDSSSSTTLPFADGTNPSILRLHNNPRIHTSITDMFPKEAKFLATICMTNSQCAWKDSPQEIQDYHISTRQEPITVRTILLVLDEHYGVLQEATMYLHVDAKYGRRIRPQMDSQTGNYPVKAMALDDARLFTNHGQIWVSYREGPNFGYDKQVLNPVHFHLTPPPTTTTTTTTTSANQNKKQTFEVTLKASETTTFCCGRNMALIDNVETNELQSITWVDPVTVVTVDDGLLEKGSLSQRQRQRRRLMMDGTHTHGKQKKKKSDFHGTNGSMLYLPNSKEYLGIGHFHRPPGRKENQYARFGHHYTHAFFTIPSQPPFHLKRLSPEFVLPSHDNKEDAEIIQFLSGLELVDDSTLVIAYGINDCEGAATHIKLDQVEAMLRDVPQGKEVVDLMEPLRSAL